MSMNQEEPTLQELVSRLAEVERANARLQERLVTLRTERPMGGEQVITPPREYRWRGLSRGVGRQRSAHARADGGCSQKALGLR